MLSKLFNRFEGAFSDNTLRAYRSDMNCLLQWCAIEGLDFTCLSGPDLARYFESIAEGLSTATLRRRLASISSVLNLAEAENNTQHPEVTLALKRIHRRDGSAQLQASPLTSHVKTQLFKACGDDTRGLRDRVMLELGYETMRRRSELCNFKFSDRVSLPDGRSGLRLSFSKTDQYGRGKIIKINDSLAGLLEQWQYVAGDQGYILRGVKPDQTVTAQLRPSSINLILKRLQREVELNLTPSLSGHSFRVGRALDLLNEGEPLPKIMLRGGWRSESSVMRYLRAWEL